MNNQVGRTSVRPYEYETSHLSPSHILFSSCIPLILYTYYPEKSFFSNLREGWMLETVYMLSLLVAAIAFIIVMTAKVKLNAFLVLLLAAFGVGLLAGMNPLEVVTTITGGFGGILSRIGIVIIAGTIIGTILEKSRATLTMADTMLRLIGGARAALAMSITGAVVSVSVFCDSGFVILSALNKSLARRSGVSMATMAVALSTGLYATHTFVPPTPGPIAAAGNLGADIGLVILLGLIVSIPAVAAGYLWAVRIGGRYRISPPDIAESPDSPGALPGRIASFAPIALPIILITLKSAADAPAHPFGDGLARMAMDFIGDPTVALLIGVFLAFRLLPAWKETYINGWVTEGMKQAAVIIMITGAGGAFGSVLQTTGIGAELGEALAQYRLGIFLPFVIALTLKTAQGSSTVALITASALVSPMLGDLGLASPTGRALAVMAVGAGAMIVSHANDSYFWVVSQFSGLDTATAYRTHTMATLVQGVTAMLVVFGLSLVIA